MEQCPWCGSENIVWGIITDNACTATCPCGLRLSEENHGGTWVTVKATLDVFVDGESVETDVLDDLAAEQLITPEHDGVWE